MEKENWIQRALHDQLTEEEVMEFEKLLNSDEALRRQFEFEKSIQQGINQEERNKLKSFFQEQERKPLVPTWVAWLAAVLVMAALGWSLWPQGVNNESLYLSYYQKFPNVVNPLTRGAPKVEDAYTFYEKEEYKKALDLLQITEGDTAAFYTSMCLIELDRDKEAVLRLEQQLFQEPLNSYRKWYLALLYLKTQENMKATKLLEELSQEDFALGNKVDELLEKIK